MNYVIDAKNKSLGRIASEAARILRGKDSPAFVPNRLPQVKLIVINLDKSKITGRKLEQKKYIRHSGYPGAQKIIGLKEIIKKRGINYIFMTTVRGMLPRNKLRDKIMKNLIIR